jgi:hypothetical protein
MQRVRPDQPQPRAQTGVGDTATLTVGAGALTSRKVSGARALGSQWGGIADFRRSLNLAYAPNGLIDTEVLNGDHLKPHHRAGAR